MSLESRSIKFAAIALAIVLAGSATAAFAQTPAKAATYITKEQVDAVNATAGVDRTLQIWDLGKVQFSVGVIHRGPTVGAARGAANAGAARGAGGAAAGAQAAGARGAADACGERVDAIPAGGFTGAISHDFQTEGYLIISGGGTLVTGGHINNGTKSAAEADVTKILNGPSCSGTASGSDIVRKVVKTGDIIIIPAGVPHGWTDIADHVDYLSFRPMTEKLLVPNYVNPNMPK
jgi:mannose-6-phosphate isomerase-like protein (cupin superfamily)